MKYVVTDSRNPQTIFCGTPHVEEKVMNIFRETVRKDDYDAVFSVLEYMKEQKLQNVPVVLVSANVNDENIRKAYAYQVADYIQKPFQEEVVKRRVEQVIKMFEKRRDMKKETAK